MKKTSVVLALIAGFISAQIQLSSAEFDESIFISNEKINSYLREPMRATSYSYATVEDALACDRDKAFMKSLDGEWKFRFFDDNIKVPEGFELTGTESGEWNGRIQVPGCIERNGFGYPIYHNTPYPFPNTPPVISRNVPVGYYLRTFTVPEAWDGRKIVLHFGGVYSGYFVWVNDTLAGYAEDSALPSEFDINGSDFVNVIVDEMIPLAAKTASVTISEDPNLHFISGKSSGGYLAWMAAWYRNDFFRRVYLSSPTFSNIRGGHEETFMIRKTEPRPIRIYMTSGTVEPDYFFGDSFYAACNAASAFECAGYDFAFDIFPRGGHGCNSDNPEFLEKMFKWMYSKKTVTKPEGAVSYKNRIPESSEWETCKVKAPGIQTKISNGNCEYFISKGKLYYKKGNDSAKKVEDAGNVTSIAFSSDMWKLYVSEKDSRFIYAYVLRDKGVPEYRMKLAPVELPFDVHCIGCDEICVSDDDHLFAATEMGVQSIRSFGINDMILPLPGNVPAIRVWLSDGFLYAMAADNTVYRRAVNAQPHDGKTVCEPSTEGYGDGFNYSRPHFNTILPKRMKSTTLNDF